VSGNKSSDFFDSRSHCVRKFSTF